ncbi:septal ring lytic transglycosylase RlpA family protein, partial [Candidatus Sumerlaeota bacterium]|nr:septal ring lytic transglycosylase RlpA family protein [Candidatus Sumerlaeota bacterium]
IVRVKDMDSGKEVVVRINNRGPFIKGRVIDLSYAAAQKLDIVDKGLTPCKVVILKMPGK